MVNTKQTKGKDSKCPMCPFRTTDPEAMRAHIVTCGLQKMEKRLKCDECEHETEKNSNLTRHKERKHADKQKLKDYLSIGSKDTYKSDKEGKEQTIFLFSDDNEELDYQDESDEDEWEKTDPGDLKEILGEEKVSSKESEKESDSEISVSGTISCKEINLGTEAKDPTTRIPTAHKPVFAPKRNSSPESSKCISLREKLKAKWKLGPLKVPNPKIFYPKAPQIETPSETQIVSPPSPSASLLTKERTSSVQDTMNQMASTGVQTEPIRNRRVVWKTTKYTDGEKDIEIVEIEEFEFAQNFE